MSNNTSDELTYGVDKGSPDGDMTAIYIKKGKTLFTFVGDEAEAIEALIAHKVNEAKSEAYQHGLITGAMPEAIGKPLAQNYLAALKELGDK
jgi:hypothetical protein